ncbi:EF-1 guanine nucleotide exchange domain containing protein [Aphelenchoides avenae]|nr:EF-1 guanine nucleotide exchange domain containing protein [Aphelenchus avenae]
MSVEALLSEVSPTLPLTQVIKSAEQLYFKEHLLHTNVVPEYHAGSSPGTSGQGQDKTSKKDKKGKGTGGHDDEDSQNPLSAAINAVKNTVSSVLGVGSQGSVSNAEVDELRKAVDTLKLDNESLRKEVSELRKLVEKVSGTAVSARVLPRFGERVLVLGDGNLSFSLSLARLYPDTAIVATVLEGEEEFLRRYPSGHAHLQLLGVYAPRVTVQFGVDATCLPYAFAEASFTDIIMNFPHPGGKTNLRRSRALLTGICHSLHSVMPATARFHLSLAKGQSGLAYEDVLRCGAFTASVPLHAKDSWQAIYLAADADLVVRFLRGML